jgi:signal peptidase I
MERENYVRSKLMATDTNQSRSPGWLRIALVGRNPKVTLLRILLLIALVLLTRAYVLLPIQIKGPSMLPTYQENGVNFINRLAYLRSEPQRGDVVAIRFSGESILLMKRILALPGETIEFRGGQVFINGERLEEKYLAPDYPCNWDIPPETLKPGLYYVVGDNRTMPEQNHTKGDASRERIIGKVLLCKNLFASSSPRR